MKTDLKLAPLAFQYYFSFISFVWTVLMFAVYIVGMSPQIWGCIDKTVFYSYSIRLRNHSL